MPEQTAEERNPNPIRLFDTFENLLAGLGVAGRDKVMSQMAVLNNLTQNRQQLEAMYRGDWLSRKIIDIPAFDSCRAWRTWQAEQDQIEKLETAEKLFGLQRKLLNALIKARLYGGSAIILGLSGTGGFNEELDLERVKKGCLQYIHVVSKWMLSAGQRVRDITSPWFGEPEYYMRTNIPITGAPGNVTPLKSRKKSDPGEAIWIHPSRVVRLIGLDYPDDEQAPDAWGDSVLQTVYDAVRDGVLVSQSLANAVSDSKVDVYKIPGLSATLATAAGTQRLLKYLSEANVAKSTVNSLVMDKEFDWERIQTRFEGLPEVLQAFLLICSAAADIPSTRLLGREPAGQNSTGESDTRNYYDRLHADQEVRLTPTLNRLDEVLLRHTLGKRDPDIHYEWGNLWQLSENEKADVAFKKAQAYKIDVDTGLLPPEALKQGRENQLIEDGTYPGLEAALDEAEALQKEQEEEADLAYATGGGYGGAFGGQQPDGGGGPGGGGKPNGGNGGGGGGNGGDNFGSSNMGSGDDEGGGGATPPDERQPREAHGDAALDQQSLSLATLAKKRRKPRATPFKGELVAAPGLEVNTKLNYYAEQQTAADSTDIVAADKGSLFTYVEADEPSKFAWVDQDIDRPQAAGVLFVDPEQDLALFLKRTDSGEWSIPAGNSEDGEDGVIAAQREAAEEVGTTPTNLEPFDRRTTNGVDFATYISQCPAFEPILNNEHSEHIWAALDQPPQPLHPGLDATLRSVFAADQDDDPELIDDPDDDFDDDPELIEDEEHGHPFRGNQYTSGESGPQRLKQVRQQAALAKRAGETMHGYAQTAKRMGRPLFGPPPDFTAAHALAREPESKQPVVAPLQKREPAGKRAPTERRGLGGSDIATIRNKLRAAHQVLQRSPETNHINTPERRMLRAQIADQLYNHDIANRSRDRHAVIITGLPAAGKTTLTKPYLQHGYLEVDADLAKEKLPEFNNGLGANAVHEESSAINKVVLRKAMRNGDNFVLGRLDNPLKLVDDIHALHKAGYYVTLKHLQLPNTEAIKSAMYRFLKGGRYVHPEMMRDLDGSSDRTYQIGKGIADEVEHYVRKDRFSDPVLVNDAASDGDRADYDELDALLDSIDINELMIENDPLAQAYVAAIHRGEMMISELLAELAAEVDHRQHRPTSDEEAGHPFRGNQYTSGQTDPKETKPAAETKPAEHEVSLALAAHGQSRERALALGLALPSGFRLWQTREGGYEVQRTSSGYAVRRGSTPEEVITAFWANRGGPEAMRVELAAQTRREARHAREERGPAFRFKQLYNELARQHGRPEYHYRLTTAAAEQRLQQLQRSLGVPVSATTVAAAAPRRGSRRALAEQYRTLLAQAQRSNLVGEAYVSAESRRAERMRPDALRAQITHFQQRIAGAPARTATATSTPTAPPPPYRPPPLAAPPPPAAQPAPPPQPAARYSARDFVGTGISLNTSADPNFFRTWDQKVGMSPAQFAHEFFGGQQMNVTLKASSGYWIFTGSVVKGDRNLASYTNTVKFADNSAYLGFFQVIKSAQAGASDPTKQASIGKQVMRGNFAFYKKWGFSKATLAANIDVGGYAWAKYGYTPTQSSWDTLRHSLMTRARSRGSPDRQLMQILNYSDPKSMWDLADSRWGKASLLGQNWSAELNLNDRESVQRFDAYVGQAGAPIAYRGPSTPPKDITPVATPPAPVIAARNTQLSVRADNNVSQEVRTKVQGYIDRLPDSHRANLNSRGINIRIIGNRGSAGGYYFAATPPHIEIADRVGAVLQAQGRNPGTVTTHEVGHAIDHASNYELSRDLTPAVVAAARANMTQNEQNVAHYWLATPKETFAEFYAHVYGQVPNVFGMDSARTAAVFGPEVVGNFRTGVDRRMEQTA